MNKFIFFILFHLPLIIEAQENLHFLSQQAEALWEAQDYKGAQNLYKSIDAFSLPKWQQHRIYYNLATLKLAQKKTIESLEDFQNIHLVDLSLPSFGRNLLINLGIAYWQYIQVHPSNPSLSRLSQDIFFLEQSLQIFNQAEILECQIQKKEDVPPSSCYSLELIRHWQKTVRLELSILYLKRYQTWAQALSIESFATLMHIQFQDIIRILSLFQEQDIPSTYFSSIHSQLSSFDSLWKILQEKKLSKEQQETIHSLMISYQKALTSLNQHEIKKTLQFLHQLSDDLILLGFQDHQSLRTVILYYEMLLMDISPSASKIEKLMTKVNHLEVEEKQLPSLKILKELLQLSLKEIQAEHVLPTSFFLIAGLNYLQSFIIEKSKEAKTVLSDSLKQAQQTLQLLLLANTVNQQLEYQAIVLAILQHHQQATLNEASSFIPTVLKEQKQLFQQAENPVLACQQFPWSQVIPLFDQGLQTAQNVEKQIKKLSYQKILPMQTETIKTWEQALELLLHPPHSDHANSHSKSNTQSSHLTDTFRLIQEMYLEDQSTPETQTKEFHSW